MTQIARPLRADARRNRERVLTAAAVVFSEHGHEAQMDDVASRAGVGVGTVYRHFPTKEALMEALAVDRFEKVLAAGQAALERDDPWEALDRRAVGGRGAARRRPRVHGDRRRAAGPDAAQPRSSSTT